jgi:hypothetical protein
MGILLLGLLGVVLYQIPWFNRRLSWRVDIAQTYIRGLIQPAGGVPTPASRPEISLEVVFPSPTPSPTGDLVFSESPGEEIQDEATPQTVTPTPNPTPLFTPTPIPERVELPVTGWEKQDWNNCGPAALSVYLKYYGWEGDQFSISNVLKPTREDRNVNVEELVYYARNYAGWLQTLYRVGGDVEMLKELIAAGIPVLIEASFTFDGAYWPNDDLWAAHYLLVNPGCLLEALQPGFYLELSSATG